MNYMWEAMLKGYDQDIEQEKIRFQPARLAYPYREVFFINLNQNHVSPEPIEVNAFYRYGAIFSALMDYPMDDYDELREVMFDILAHYLTWLDLHEGMSRAEYYAKFLREDIAAGLFGDKNAERIKSFSRKEKRLVAAGLLRMYKVGTSMRLLAQLLRELYPNSITYLDVHDKERELLIYVGKKQTKTLSSQLDLLCDMFVPADYEVILFWDLHFGLIDTVETMEIGGIMMY